MTHRMKAAIWMVSNRGKLTEIARKVQMSPHYVSMILGGTRHNEKVERLLREAGAPVKRREE